MSGRSPVRCAVIGVGNPMMTDDGVGEAVLQALARSPLPENVRLIWAGADPLRVLQDLPDLDAALVIDAADMQLTPGTVRAFDADEAVVRTRMDGLSVHGIDLNAVLLLAKRLGVSHKLRFLGVQPASLAPGERLSPLLQARLAGLVERVREELAELSETFDRRPTCDLREESEGCECRTS